MHRWLRGRSDQSLVAPIGFVALSLSRKKDVLTPLDDDQYMPEQDFRMELRYVGASPDVIKGKFDRGFGLTFALAVMVGLSHHADGSDPTNSDHPVGAQECRRLTKPAGSNSITRRSALPWKKGFHFVACPAQVLPRSTSRRLAGLAITWREGRRHRLLHKIRRDCFRLVRSKKRSRSACAAPCIDLSASYPHGERR